ncbi:MAG: proton-conducting transporter membrane subunit [Leadbetterella sp.]|nr:proton-conducting transporter membrane subunit [Leadbetterella sp.]
MEIALQIFILIPFVGFLLSLLIPENKESFLSWLAVTIIGLQLILSSCFTILWLLKGRVSVGFDSFSLYQTNGYSFFLSFYFDKISAIYLLVGGILVSLVTRFSRYYLHREPGYKRFFNTVLFFYTGYSLTVLSGNLETLFIGWEILGICSFLLIAFYRNRYLPVKNAVKVFSVYRIGDIGIILAMWMSHHLWHENITFQKLNNYELVHEHLLSHSSIGVFIAMMLVLAAAVKSAQLPFSSWLPRAMEGPTPSSAIFYGSLSVHIGVFLLLRTFHFIEQQTSVRIFIAILGLVTALVATGIGRVQSSIKSQIAYGSIAQIGVIFIEVALGFQNLALFHFAGNAFLRTYQLLVSPSVVTYLIREQFYRYSPDDKSIEYKYPTKIANSLYILCLKEFNLDNMMYGFLWNPMKIMGKKIRFLSLNQLIMIFVPLYFGGILLWIYQANFSAFFIHLLPIVFSLIGLLMVLKAFTERYRARMSWVLILLNHALVALSIFFNEHFSLSHVLLYLSGILVMGLFGYFTLRRIKRIEGNIDLDRFHGHVYEHPKIAFAFFLACLGVSGFPITPSFIGEDLIFSHIHEDQLLLAFLTALSLIIDGLAIIRIFARVFFGPHTKTYHEVAYRSS